MRNRSSLRVLKLFKRYVMMSSNKRWLYTLSSIVDINTICFHEGRAGVKEGMGADSLIEGIKKKARKIY